MTSSSEGQSCVDGISLRKWRKDRKGDRNSSVNALIEGTITYGLPEEGIPQVHRMTDTLQDFLSDDGDHMSWENIHKVVTVNALCDMEDPVKGAFEVHAKLCHLAKTTTENTKSLEELADNVQDFAFDFLDQVKKKEDMYINDKDMDRYGSLFSDMTDNAIAEQQKKVLKSFDRFLFS